MLRPKFEIVTGTASAAERRIVSVAQVRALTGLTTGDIADAVLELMIDGVLGQCATYCKLARSGAAPLTLAQEAVRATWPAETTVYGAWPAYWFLDSHRTQILLPWRVPITAIEITEGGVELVEDTGFRLLGAGVVERINACWSGEIVADYTAGWVAPPDDDSEEVGGETMPADLQAAVAEQVKYRVMAIDRDPGIRSISTQDVGQTSFAVPGGDSIGSSGLLIQVETALSSYRNFIV